MKTSPSSGRADGARSVEPGFSPLDDELALVPGSLSPTLQQVVALLGASMPFRQVLPVLSMVARVKIGRATVARATEQAGAALVAVETALVHALEADLPESPVEPRRLQVSTDGAMVPVRGGGFREAKTMAVGELSDAAPGKTTAISYVSRLQDVDRFNWLTTYELHRRGVFAAEQVVAVVDGAQWCQSFLDYHLPHVVRVLDFPHAVEHLADAAQACFGPGTEQASEWLGVQAHTLKHADPKTVVAAVAALPAEQATDPGLAVEVRDRVHAYLETRLAQMDYAGFLTQGLPIGSGMVESANKLVVEVRLKGSGMHWNEQNVDAMLALRCAICSERWAEVWPQISRQRRQTACRSQPRPPVPQPVAHPEPTPHPPKLDRPPSAAQPPMVVNGKPTIHHPWKRNFCNSRQPHAASILKN